MTLGDWISALALIVTAVGVIWAVVQHIRAQQLSAKLAVLEHRRRIYDRLRDVLLELNSCGDDVNSVWVHAHQLWIDSEFLYGADVRDYLKDIADRLSALEAHIKVWKEIHRTGSKEERQHNVSKRDTIQRWLRDQHQARAIVFARYLQLP